MGARGDATQSAIDEHAADLALIHRELIELGSPMLSAEGDVIVTVATIIDHCKRVLIGQDQGYRLEKARVVLAEARHLVELLGGEA